MMRRSEDVSTVMGPSGTVSMEYRQGTVVAWNVTDGTNQVSIGGVVHDDLPILGRISAMSIRPGDVVGICKWRAQYFILGIVANPGTQADVTIHQGVLTIDGGQIVLQGGDDLLVEDGEIKVTDADGGTAVRLYRTDFGTGQITTYHANGAPHMAAGRLHIEETGEPTGQGWFVQRDDGVDLIAASRQAPDEPEIVRIHEPGGSRVLDTDPGGLLNRPFMDQPLYCLSSQGSFGYDGTDYQTIWEGRMWVTHPAIHAQVFAWTTDSSTDGRIQFLVDNGQVGVNHVISGGAGNYFDFNTPQNLDPSITSNPYSFVRVSIRSRVESGTGFVFVRPYGVTKIGAV